MMIIVCFYMVNYQNNNSKIEKNGVPETTLSARASSAQMSQAANALSAIQTFESNISIILLITSGENYLIRMF